MEKIVKMTRKFKLKKYQIILGSLVLGAVVILASVSLYFNHYLNTAASKDNKEIEFTIYKGEGVRTIAKNLEENKLIKNDFPLLVYLKLTGHAADLKAGLYKLSTTNTPLEVVDILTKGKVASRKITIPEGWDDEDIAKYLEEQGIVKKDDFIAATKEKYDYDFLAGQPEGSGVEGFLFPDTYQIPYHADSKYIINKMLENFDKRLGSDVRSAISGSKYNIYQTVTLASIVEREVSKPEDRKTVAGIFLARLDEGQALQSDVTLQYIYGKEKKTFTYDETTVESLYNTYKYRGLPYGPICNPGLESINAVLNPSLTDFRYFLAADGKTYYSKTFEEHEANKQRYLDQ
jgi:UPF0755 protein